MRNRLTASTYVRQGEALRWLTRAREQTVTTSRVQQEAITYAVIPNFLEGNQLEKGFVVWFYRKQALTGKQAHQHYKL